VAECKDDLAAAIAMILADRREDTKRGTSNRAVGEMVAVF